jgi:hypothetical protein
MTDRAVFSFRKGSTGGSFPRGLTNAEIAVNTHDGKLYVGGNEERSSFCKDEVEVLASLPQVNRMTTEHFDIIVPAFRNEGIKIAQLLYNLNESGMSVSAPTFNESSFRNYLNIFLGDGTYGWKKMARESGYPDYVGLSPYMLMLDTEPYMAGFAADLNKPITNQDLINALEYLNRAHDIMKEVSPSSIITEYSFPNLPGFFACIPGDCADWARKPGAVPQIVYENEKNRLINEMKKRLIFSIAPSGPYIDHVDWGNFSAYAYYYRSIMDANPYLFNWRRELSKADARTSIEALNGRKPSSCIISPLAYINETTVFTDAAAIALVPNTIWLDADIEDLLIKPVADNGMRKFIFWMDWIPFYADNAKRTPISTTSVGNPNWTRTSPGNPSVGDNEVFFSRKILNDLIVDAGVGSAIDITDNASWSGNLSRKTLAISAGVVKTVRMAQLVKKQFAGQNTAAHCRRTTSTIPLNNTYDYDILPTGYTSNGDRWLTGGSEFTWIDGIDGGSWVEANSTQITATPILVNDNYLSVRDFGAVGDGKTDDTLSIQRALNTVASMTAFGSLTADKFLLFPPGTYKIGPSSVISQGRPGTSNGSTIESCLYLGLTGSLTLIGQNATLSCVPSDPLIPHASHMMILQGKGYDIRVDGLNFEGNNKSVFGLKLIEDTESGQPFVSTAKVTNCTFQNLWTPKPAGYRRAGDAPVELRGVAGHAEATGLVLYGAWKNAVVDKCTIKNISRERGAGVPGGVGTCGITIQGGYYGPVLQYLGCKSGTVSNCYIENITSNEPVEYSNEEGFTGENLNADCDGLKFFGGLTNGSEYINCRASIYGNHFVNCRGRDIKIQADEVTIANNTSSLAVCPIRFGGVRVNCQITSGIVANNVFHFEPVQTTGGLKSPFIDDGGLTAGGSVFSFYDGNADLRNRAITVSNNTVYNNVPTSVGVLSTFFDNAEGDFVNNMPPLYATLKANKIVGIGGIQRFGVIAGRQTNANVPYFPQNPTYYTISDNMVSCITGGQGKGITTGQNPAFLHGSGQFDRCYISMHGNVHAGGYSVPHFLSSTSTIPPFYQAANINAWSNVGIGITEGPSQVYEKTGSFSIVPRLDGIADPEIANGGMIFVQSTRLNPGDTYVFPKKGYYGYGKFCMLSAGPNWGRATQALFVQGSDRLIPITVGSHVTFGSPTSTTNLGLTGYMNVWVDADSCINVQQKMLPNNGSPENVPAPGGFNYSSVLGFDLFTFG